MLKHFGNISTKPNTLSVLINVHKFYFYFRVLRLFFYHARFAQKFNWRTSMNLILIVIPIIVTIMIYTLGEWTLQRGLKSLKRNVTENGAQKGAIFAATPNQHQSITSIPIVDSIDFLDVDKINKETIYDVDGINMF